eukprot:GHVN01050991.1.p1 GENE.GHVN01050991.1~~GHVN01050991.1.p1  ORF type:complete len:458 (-),score=63.97 GHVN01050991.1:3360-4733(-)
MVLQEVNWMALDFYEERKWKVHTALKLSRAIRHRNQAKEQAKETYVANRCSSLIQSFWLGVVDQVAPQCIPRDIQPYIMRFPSRCHVDEYQDAKLVWQRRTYNADLSPDQLGDSTKEDRKEEVLVVEVPQMSDCDAIDDGSRGGVKGEGRPFLSTLWTEPPEKGENNLEFSVTNDDTDTGRDQHTAGGEKFVPFAIEDIPKWRNQEYPALDVKLYEYCLELVSQECLNSDVMAAAREDDLVKLSCSKLQPTCRPRPSTAQVTPKLGVQVVEKRSIDAEEETAARSLVEDEFDSDEDRALFDLSMMCQEPISIIATPNCCSHSRGCSIDSHMVSLRSSETENGLAVAAVDQAKEAAIDLALQRMQDEGAIIHPIELETPHHSIDRWRLPLFHRGDTEYEDETLLLSLFVAQMTFESPSAHRIPRGRQKAGGHSGQANYGAHRGLSAGGQVHFSGTKHK